MTAAPGPCGACGTPYGVCANELIDPCCGRCEHAVVPIADRRSVRNAEQHEILGAFADLLAVPTGDGGNKRAAGMKPFWKVDPGHPAASGRHRAKHANGERYDATSGAHHLVHSAWRDLATAYQEMVEDGLIPESPGH